MWRKPNIAVVPDENDEQLETNLVNNSEHILYGNKPIRLSREAQENFIEIIENPPEPAPHVIEAFNRYLKRKK